MSSQGTHILLDVIQDHLHENTLHPHSNLFDSDLVCAFICPRRLPGEFCQSRVIAFAGLIGRASSPMVTALYVPGLLRPGSRCTACLTPLRFYQNIPIASFIFLSGKCGFCTSSYFAALSGRRVDRCFIGRHARRCL